MCDYCHRVSPRINVFEESVIQEELFICWMRYHIYRYVCPGEFTDRWMND